MNYITLLITITPGIWILWNYFVKRSFAPKIRSEIFGNLIGKDISNQILLRTNLKISNTGEVRFKASQIILTIRGINKFSKFKKGNILILNQVEFDQKIYQENLIPSDWGYSFIDPGVTQDYYHSILVPNKIQYLLLEAKIFYKNSNDFQITSNIITI